MNARSVAVPKLNQLWSSQLHLKFAFYGLQFLARQRILLVAPVAMLTIIFVFGRWYQSDATRLIRIARTHGIEINREIISLEPLDSYSTGLGRSGHETFRVTLTQEAFHSLLKQIRESAPQNIAVDINSFGFTMEWSTACRKWASYKDNHLFVIAVKDEDHPIVEICSSW